MRTLSSFTHVSLDGFYADRRSQMNWAHADPDDAEWNEFVRGNAGSGGALVFGRLTYELMAQWWPTPLAKQQMPEVAEGMNRASKVVVSRTLERATWTNTRVLRGDLVAEIAKLKCGPGSDLCILGSGSLVAPLAEAGLIDEVQIVVNPIALGEGKALFSGVGRPLRLALAGSRTFANGKVVLRYTPDRR